MGFTGEKEHLKNLKKKDSKKYNEVIRMMEDEYLSSLYWYKYYQKSVLNQVHIKPLDIFRKKIQRIKKEKNKKKKIKEAEKIQKPPTRPPKEEIKKSIPDKISIDSDRKHDTLMKIKKAQNKQREKYGNKIKT